MTITPQALAFAQIRGLSEKTLTALHVTAGRANFGTREETNTHDAIVFQYIDENGEIANYKARALDAKLYKAKPGAKPLAYNWGTVTQGDRQEIYITEGEMDALSLVEAGISPDSVLSVPSGAPKEAKEGSDLGKRYDWLLEAVSGPLAASKRYILCTDNDGPGFALRQDMVRILGAAKVWYVDWPDGIKDANEYLMKHGPDELRSYVSQEQKPWPVKGLFQMSEIPEPAPLELWELGFAEFGDKIRLAPSMLSAVTGFPGHGKSLLMQQIWCNVAREYDFPIAIMSAETRAKPHVRRNLRQCYWRKAEREMSPRELKIADDWIEAHFYVLDSGDEQPTVPWLIESIEVATQRYGCRAAIIDPWNKIAEDFDIRGDTETRWIGRTLDTFIAMSRGLTIHTQIIAHPAKPDSHAKNYAPDLYSISGSSHWNNRVDQGFCVYRERTSEGSQRVTTAEFRQLKTRFEELGYPCVLGMNYDVRRGVYECTEYDRPMERKLQGVGP